MNVPFIDLKTQYLKIKDEVKKELDEVIDNTAFVLGQKVKNFEQNFATFCNKKYAVALNSGTSSLHLALIAKGVKQGDEVITVPNTFIATAEAISYTGAKPIFVDIDPKTYNINPNKIKKRITEKTKVILPVHLYGQSADISPIIEIAEKHNLEIIEDCCQAHGAEYKGKKIGSLGDLACFSFYSNKIITTGEGGIVVTNNEKFAEKARLLRNHAFTKPRFLHHELGFNYRMTNIQAAIGLAQTENADKLLNARIKNANIYNKLLKDVPGIILPPKKDWAKNVYWMYGIIIKDDFGINATTLREELKKAEIDTRSFFIGMHNQPMFQNTKRHNNPDISGDFANSEYLEKRGLYLPSSSSLTESQINQVVNAIISIQENFNE